MIRLKRTDYEDLRRAVEIEISKMPGFALIKTNQIYQLYDTTRKEFNNVLLNSINKKWQVAFIKRITPYIVKNLVNNVVHANINKILKEFNNDMVLCGCAKKKRIAR